VDVIAALTDYGIAVTTYDPIAKSLGSKKKKYNLVTKTNCPNSNLMLSYLCSAISFRIGLFAFCKTNEFVV
jgi:hypothetical protein